MAAHHPHHHHCYNPPPPPTHCYCTYPPPPPPPPPPPTATAAADPLLHLLAAHILQPHQKPVKPKKTQHHVLHSLASRVAALELSVTALSSSSPFSSVPPTTLRDAAARVIQRRFRALLARRSRALCHLRLLASIKSNLALLRATFASNRKVDLAGLEAVSRKAGEMLAQLDAVQGGDAMIQEGKKSVAAELVQFLEYLDGLVKTKTFSVKTAKKVTFASHGNDSGFYPRDPQIESDSQSELSTDDQHVSGDKECSVSDDEGSHADLESFPQIDEELNNHVVNLSGNGRWRKKENVGGSLFAPLPIKMEPRLTEPDAVKKKKVVRIVSP